MARRTTTPPPPEDFEEKIVGIDVEEEMQNAFLEYSYSVIYSPRPARRRATASSPSSGASSTAPTSSGCVPTAATSRASASSAR